MIQCIIIAVSKGKKLTDCDKNKNLIKYKTLEKNKKVFMVQSRKIPKEKDTDQLKQSAKSGAN